MPTVLGQVAERNHWTPRDGVRAFEETARKLGEPTVKTISERQWERWCAGNLRSRPQPAARRILEAMTGYPIDELLSPGSVPVAQRQSNDTIDPKGLLTMAARRARDWITAVEATNAGPETLSQLRDELAVLAQSYPREPLPTLLPDLVEVQNVVFRLLDGRHSPDTARDLYLYAGVSSGMVAKASHDLGNPRSALTHARLAYLCATQAGHTGMRSWIRGLQSLIAYWADWPQDALRYARNGVHESGNTTTGTTAAWLASLEARALARLGMPTDARHALDRAETLREHVAFDELDELGGLLTFTAPKHRYYRADTCVLLPGDAAEAEQEAATAVTAYEHAADAEVSFSDLAGSRADLALARVRLGHVEGAYEAMRPILDLPPALRIGGIIPSVQRVSDAVSPPAGRSPVAETMLTEIEEFTRNRAPVLP